MKSIECRDMASKKSHDQMGETGVQCDLTNVGGLICKNDAQPDKACSDYEIRVFCDECPTTGKILITKIKLLVCTSSRIINCT